MKSLITFLLLLLVAGPGIAQQQTTGNWWRAQLHRTDGRNIVFNFEWITEKGKPVWYIRNAGERLRVTDIQVNGDSMIVQMPLFESQFRIKKEDQGARLAGVWIKGGAVKTQVIPFTAEKGGERFPGSAVALRNINGR